MSGMKILKRKKIVHYNFDKKPIRPTPIMVVPRVGSWLMCLQRKVTIEYIGEKPKGTRLILGNHGAFNDFYLLYKAIKTNKLNYVVALDAHNDVFDWLVRSIGSMAKRKFISDLALMRNLKYAIDKLKDSVVMYPEARYSLDGTTSYLPPSLGKCIKYLDVPVTMLLSFGNYISDPQWNKYKQNKMPMHAKVFEILSLDEVRNLSVDEINAKVQKAFEYDDWKWLKDNNVKLTYKNRAGNLNAILYQCPHCKTEFKMQGEGTTLTCTACNKAWELNEDGTLTAHDGITEFSHVPDWFKWEKENVYNEVFSGKYKMEADCNVYTLPATYGFVPQKQGKLYQDSYKTVLNVNLYGEDKVIEYTGTQLESVHIEYRYKGVGDMLDFSIRGDSVWMQPLNKKDVITKISLATEAIRDLARNNLKK